MEERVVIDLGPREAYELRQTLNFLDLALSADPPVTWILPCGRLVNRQDRVKMKTTLIPALNDLDIAGPRLEDLYRKGELR